MSDLAGLHSQLVGEVSTLERFCALLEEEHQVLTGNLADRLPEIATRKATLAAELSQKEADRNRWLAQRGLPAGREGMAGVLEREPAHRALGETWNTLIGLAAKARSANEANGRLISLLLRHNQEALDLLLANGNGSVYGPDGQTRSPTGGRSFGAV